MRSGETTPGELLGGSQSSILFHEGPSGGIQLCPLADFNQITNNIVSMNDPDGITLYDAWNNDIAGNTVANNAGTGIVLFDFSLFNNVGPMLNPVSEAVVVPGNTVYGHQNAGILVEVSPENTVHGNNIGMLVNSEEMGNGVGVLVRSWRVLVRGNDIQFSGEHGVLLEWFSDNVVDGNPIHDNPIGVTLRAESGNHRITNNTIEDNGLGIVVESWNNWIAANEIRNNTRQEIALGDTGAGIFFAGGAGGNRVFKNNIRGNRAQESWGIFNEIGNPKVDARRNFFGGDDPATTVNEAELGPYAPGPNPGGTGDSIAGLADFRDWRFEPLAVPDNEPPAVAEAIALPDTVSRLSLFGDFNDNPDLPWAQVEGISGGPSFTNFIVRVHDQPSGVARVTVDLRALVEAMLPFDDVTGDPLFQIKPGREKEFDKFLERLEDRELFCNRDWELCWRHLNLGELVFQLEHLIHGNLFATLVLGNFDVPATIWDFADNKTVVPIRLAIVDQQVPVAKEAWTPVSTPMALSAESDTWGKVTSMGDGLAVKIAYRWNSQSQAWEQMLPGTPVRPLEGIMVKAGEDGAVPFVYNRDLTAPPQRPVGNGWNFTAIAVTPPQGPNLGLDAALKSIEDKGGVPGYTTVLSLTQDMQRHDDFSVTVKRDPLGASTSGPESGESGPDEVGLAPIQASRVIYVKYEGHAKPSDTIRYFKEYMVHQVGWELVDWFAGQDDAFAEFFKKQGSAQFIARIDVIGEVGIHIQLKIWEPGEDLRDVLRFCCGGPVFEEFDESGEFVKKFLLFQTEPIMIGYSRSGGEGFAETHIDYQPFSTQWEIFPPEAAFFYLDNLWKFGWNFSDLDIFGASGAALASDGVPEVLQGLIDSGVEVDAATLQATIEPLLPPGEDSHRSTWVLWFYKDTPEGSAFVQIRISGSDNLIQVWHDFSGSPP